MSGTTQARRRGDRATAAAGRPVRRAVTRLVLRQVRRGGLLVAVIVAGMSAMVVSQYEQVAGEAGGAAFQALAENPAIRTLFGTPVALDDPGGFTVWRTGTPVAVLVGVWAMLAATRTTRGEEDAGRSALVLSGRITLPALVARTVLVLVWLQVVVGVALATALIATGTSAAGAWRYGVAVAGVGAVGAALGVACGQVVGERRSASGLGAAVLGTWLLLRMVADGVPELAWLRWLGPFGLLAEVEPYAANRLVPLAAMAVLALVLGLAAVRVAGRRDVGAGVLPVRERRAARTRLLRSVAGFAVRRTGRPFLGWAVGLAAYYLLIGVLATSLTRFLTDNPRFAELAAAAGFAGLGTVEGYVAALYGVLGVPVGLFAASRVAVLAADESDGRLAPLFSAPVSRTRWLATESLVVALGAVALTLVVGLVTWAGTALVAAPLGLVPSVAGALNTATVALLCLGAAVLALGTFPRAVLAVGAVPAVGGFLLQVLAETFGWPSRVAQLSPFQHVAGVPLAPPDWPGVAGLLAVAALLLLVGVHGFGRRDLTG